MNLILDELVLILSTGLIPFLRISAMMLAAPLVSLEAVNIRIRISISLLLTIFIYPSLDLPIVDPTSLVGLSLIARELIIGLLFALTLQVVNSALVVAGQFISMTMGLGMAQTVDPSSLQVPVLSSFFIVISTLVFISVGGHLILIRLIIDSFIAIPINGPIDLPLTIWRYLEWTAMVFLGAVLVALPIVLIMLLVNLCLGTVTRAAPALNIFAVGFPAMLLIGLLLIFTFLVNISNRIEWLWLRAFEKAQMIWVI